MDEIIKLYKPGMTPEKLANAVFRATMGDKKPSLPINPFSLMKKFGVIYQFMDFKGLEGIYIVPEDEEDIPMVGINISRPITRQRYTAAHELCHHLKDGVSEICEINSSKYIERYAEKFAAELLMPKDILRTEVNKYLKNGLISLDDVLLISDLFGVSFRACAYRIAYSLGCLDGDTDPKILNKRITKYKPDVRKQKIGLEKESTTLLRQAFDDYEFYFQLDEKAFWYKFKADFIYNENRMEGVQISREEVDEILADLRLNKQKSEFCKEPYQNIIEVLGHSEIYDFILETDSTPSIYSILSLNKQLFQYAPFPEEAGKTRTTNNSISGAAVETVDFHDIATELFKLTDPVNELVSNPTDFSMSQYLLQTIWIHHRITQIHPFCDGNGRASRALMNWMLKYKKMPPFYIEYEDKNLYYDALEKADVEQNYTDLLKLFIKEIIKTRNRINQGK